MFGEPPRTQADLNFMLFGVPVRVHPLFWLMAAFWQLDSSAPEVLTWVAAVFLSILVHELGHALVIRTFGWYPWIVLYGMGGLTFHDQSSASGSRGSGSFGQILISLAGPAAGFLLIAVILLGFVVAGHGHQIELRNPAGLIPIPAVRLSSMHLRMFFGDISFICIFWGLANLLPIYPLDGGKIAREILLLVRPRDGVTVSFWLSTVAATALAVISLTQWHDWFIAAIFGYLAYSNYVTLQVYRGRKPW